MSGEEATLKRIKELAERAMDDVPELVEALEAFEKKMRILRTNTEVEFAIILEEIERGTYNAPYGLMELYDRCFSVLKDTFREVLGVE